jgi:triphosphoribosyl-dephospho-CoA synthase
VHRGADFEDVTLLDFVASAVAIGPVLDRAAARPLGETVWSAVRATRGVTATNTNLGIILLLAPLASVPRPQDVQRGVCDVLTRLTHDDALQVYGAIRLAQPGGLGRAAQMDVAGTAPRDLLAARRAAADRDLVARQYVMGFDVVFDLAERLSDGQREWGLVDAIVHVHLQAMSQYPDSLIARKCGLDTARQAAARAGQVLGEGPPGSPAYTGALANLDFWLRSDGHRRNPGTTADLVTAALFVALRDGRVLLPRA